MKYLQFKILLHCELVTCETLEQFRLGRFLGLAESEGAGTPVVVSEASREGGGALWQWDTVREGLGHHGPLLGELGLVSIFRVFA